MTRNVWGDKAYRVSYTNYINGKYIHPPQAKITEHVITKLGNKYLYTEDKWTRFEINTGREDKDYGDIDIVFPTYQAAEEYVKRNHVLKTLAKYFNSAGDAVARNLPTENLEQLLNYFEVDGL